MLKQAKRIIFIFYLFYGAILSAQTSTATYSSGDIPTGFENSSQCAPLSELQVIVPPGSIVTSVDVVYQMTARVQGWMSDQRSRLIYVEGAVSENNYTAGIGDSPGTLSYARSGLTIANGVSVSGVLTFQMDVLRVIWEGTGAGCSVNENKVDNNSWIITVNYTAPPPVAEGYLGPGGVGSIDGTSSLVLWTNPDDISENDNAPFASWSDLSGYNSTLTQEDVTFQPIIKKNIVNGYDAVRFEESNRRLRKTNFTNFPTTAISGFYVNKTENANEGGDGVLSYASSSALNNDFLLFNSNNLSMYVTNQARGSGLNVSTANWNVIGYRWQTSGTANTSLNGTDRNINFPGGRIITPGGSLALAGEQDSEDDGAGGNDGDYVASQAHQGDFAEVIMYNKYINEAERIIVSNYLSAKYNITLNSNNFYDEDDSAAGNFDYDVAGIGQATDGSNHVDSQGTGIVRIYNPSSLANDEFLFWGRDNKEDIVFETNEDNYQQRTSTKWRVSKRNDVGDVSFILDLSSVDISSKEDCAVLKLVIDNDSDLLSPTSTYDLADIGGGLYQANNVVFSNNDYFAVEYQDLIVVDDTQYYNGSAITNVPDLTDGCFKLLVKSTSNGSLTLTEDAVVREIEIENGGILSVNSGVLLKVKNGILNNGELRLVGNSQLVQTHTTGNNLNSGTGKLFVDQTATSSSVYQSGYWSSPVRNSGTTPGTPFSINDVLKDGTNVATSPTSTVGEAADINFTPNFDGDSSSEPISISSRWLAKFVNASDWTRFVDPTDPIFLPGEGWNMKSVGATFTFSGIPNDGDYSFTLDQNKFNLIGNPYPSALDAEAFINDNSSEFNGVIYIYNGSSDNTHVRGDYSGTYNTIVSGVTVGGGRYLPIGQGFFVTKETPGSGTLVFKNSQRTLNDLSDTGVIVAKTSSKQKSTRDFSTIKIDFKFNLSESEVRTRTVATVFRGLTDEYDIGFDAVMWGLQPTDLYLKVKGSTSPYIITGTFNFDESLEIPMVVQLDQDREVTFSISEKIKINTPVYLNDRVLNKFYNLDEAPKSLNLASGTYDDRFFITFTDKTLTNEDFKEDEFLLSIQGGDNGEFLIKNTSNYQIETVKLFNILGAEVFNQDINSNKSELNFKLNKLSKAVYILVIKTEKGLFNKKIIID